MVSKPANEIRLNRKIIAAVKHYNIIRLN